MLAVLGCIMASAAPALQSYIGRQMNTETTTDGYRTWPPLGLNHLTFAEEYWANWQFVFQKKYPTEEEKERRFKIFKDNMLIRNTSNKPNGGDFYGINKYSDLTHEEYMAILASTTTEDPELQKYTEDIISQFNMNPLNSINSTNQQENMPKAMGAPSPEVMEKLQSLMSKIQQNSVWNLTLGI